MDALSLAEEEVDDARSRTDQEGGESGDEHGPATDEALLVVLPVRSEGPRRGPDDQSDQRQGQGPSVESVHEVLEDVPTRERTRVRGELQVRCAGQEPPCPGQGARCPERQGRVDRSEGGVAREKRLADRSEAEVGRREGHPGGRWGGGEVGSHGGPQ